MLPGRQPRASRNCKVITTCFVGRVVRERTQISGEPPGPFVHCQNFPTPEKVLELVEYIFELERKTDPGVPVDTIIVNNDVGWEKGNRYLDSLENAATFSGRVRVMHRENFGRSFGGYNAAFERYRLQYDYWTFTEDDILIVGDGYFKICIDDFTRKPKTGFVAIQGLSRYPTRHRTQRLHAHGGVGTTRTDVLEHVYAGFGRLPHPGPQESQTYTDVIRFGEVPFTNAVSRLGYKLVTVSSPHPLYAFAYDHMRGITSDYPESLQRGERLHDKFVAEIRTDIHCLAFRLKRLMKSRTGYGY